MSTSTPELKVAAIQSALHWMQPEANLAMFEEKIWQLPEPADLIVLPEMFTTGFGPSAWQHAEPMNLTTFKWMRQQATQTGAVIAGSFPVKEGNQFFNRLLWMQPDGRFTFYDKKHLFGPGGETEKFSAGTQQVNATWKGWTFRLLICYDLRFPVWSRNLPDQPYDCLVYVANWPTPRSHAWRILLQARAIENQAYCIGVNRVGQDEAGMQYHGESAVIDPLGKHLYQFDRSEGMAVATLRYEEMAQFRQKLPFWQDADSFLISPLP